MTMTTPRRESAVSPIPEGFHSITPTLTVKGAAAAIEFYQQAFGAQEIDRAPSPDGQQIMHATIQIGDSRLMLNDEFPDMGCVGPLTLGGSPQSIFLYVEDVDAVFKQAVDAGATAVMDVNDAFWGDRWGSLKDPFGHSWSIATRKRNLSMEETMANFKEAMANNPECAG